MFCPLWHDVLGCHTITRRQEHNVEKSSSTAEEAKVQKAKSVSSIEFSTQEKPPTYMLSFVWGKEAAIDSRWVKKKYATIAT